MMNKLKRSKNVSILLTILIIFISLATLTSCKGSTNKTDMVTAKNISNQVNSEKLSEAPTSHPTPTDFDLNNSVLESYKAVLQDKTEFFSTDNKKNLYLQDFLTNNESYEVTFQITHFTVLDMDGDQTPEVVLELSVGDEPAFYEVLHNINGDIYGYLIVYRGLEELKEDGTFLYSSGAADTGSGKLIFELDGYKTGILGYSESSQSDTNFTISYYIDNKAVTKEAFDSFLMKQSDKKDAIWYEFTQENIENELSNK